MATPASQQPGVSHGFGKQFSGTSLPYGGKPVGGWAEGTTITYPNGGIGASGLRAAPLKKPAGPVNFPVPKLKQKQQQQGEDQRPQQHSGQLPNPGIPQAQTGIGPATMGGLGTSSITPDPFINATSHPFDDPGPRGPIRSLNAGMVTPEIPSSGSVGLGNNSAAPMGAAATARSRRQAFGL